MCLAPWLLSIVREPNWVLSGLLDLKNYFNRSKFYTLFFTAKFINQYVYHSN